MDGGTVNASLRKSSNSSNSTSSPTTRSYALETKDLVIFGFLGVLGVLIIIANSTVLHLFRRKSSLRTKTNLFLVSLALSDLLTGLLCIPLIVLCSVPETWSITVCIGMDLTQRFLAISTILHLLGATLERYIKIVTPFRYLTLMTWRRVVGFLASVWAISLFSSLIQLSWINPHRPSEGQKIEAVYSIVCLAVFVLVPFLCIAFAYGRILGVIRRERKGYLFKNCEDSRRDERKKRNESRVVFIYIAMTLSFLLGWLSYFLSSLDQDLDNFMFAQVVWLYDLFLFLRFATSLVNPLLYTFFKVDFQIALGLSKRPDYRNVSLSTKAGSLSTLASISVGLTQAQRLSIVKSNERIRRCSSEPNRPEAQDDEKAGASKSLVGDESV